FMTLPHADSPPRGALWNRDETRILSWQQDRVARLWEADTGAALFSLDNPPTLGGAAWTADERSIFTWANPAGNSQLIRLWDADTGELRLSLPDQLMSGLDALSMDESHLLTWAFDGSLTLWELASQSAQMTWRHAGIQ